MRRTNGLSCFILWLGLVVVKDKLWLLNIVLYDLGYRSIRFGISFYTIRDIVLYDLEYRTIRFGISYYTIRNIVLYDSVNRCPVQPKPG